LRAPVLLLIGAAAWAHDPVTTKLTWTAEISRIVYKRCAPCHREGGIAPMPLVDYPAARPWAKAIRDEVLNRRMPPWGAVKGFGDFRGDLSLTQDEINRIVEWVEGGAPEGDPRYLPTFLPAPYSPPALPAGQWIRTTRFARAVVLLGIRPVSDAVDAKTLAVLPDGAVEPLLWLSNYRAAAQRTFVFREPVPLPAATRIVSDIGVELLIRSPKRAH
jgi:hypothetical protein